MSFQLAETYAVVGASNFTAACSTPLGLYFQLGKPSKTPVVCCPSSFNGKSHGNKAILTITKSKILDATSIEEDVQVTENDWETEKCIYSHTDFQIMLYLLISNSNLPCFSIFLLFPGYFSFYLYTFL